MNRINKAIWATFVGHSVFLLVALALTGRLVHHYWYGEYGYFAVHALKTELAEQVAQNTAQKNENDRLKADIKDLQSGLVAVEEHARLTLGLIKPNELFVQVLNVPDVSAVQNQMPVADNAQAAVEVAGIEESAQNSDVNPNRSD